MRSRIHCCTSGVWLLTWGGKPAAVVVFPASGKSSPGCLPTARAIA